VTQPPTGQERRERFANRLRISSIDQDEQHEYAGRLCAQLDGMSIRSRSLEEAETTSHSVSSSSVLSKLGAKCSRK
jgi:hypothetical protein